MKTSINKVLLFFTIALLITNIVLVFFLWKDKKPNTNNSKGGRGEWMANELKLDDKQKAEHKTLKEAHFAKLKSEYDSITANRSRLYSLLKDSVINDSLVNYYIKVIGEKNSLISQYTFEHFKRIRAICNSEQKLKLDTVIQKIVKNMGGKESRPKSSK